MKSILRIFVLFVAIFTTVTALLATPVAAFTLVSPTQTATVFPAEDL